MPTYPRYGQFCPVAMASEVLGSRWTIPILREMLCGSTRFNELRKGLPRMSPALLSQRLRDLEKAGILRRVGAAGGNTRYQLTRAGEDLREVVEGIGAWGQRWVDADISLRNLDASLLMWDMRRRLNPGPIEAKRIVVQFLYPEQSQGKKSWWLVIDGGDVDLCGIEPGFDVDLEVQTDLKTMTEVWMGYTTVAAAVRSGRLTLTGNAALKRSFHSWLGLSSFAVVAKERTASVAPRVA